MFLLIVFSVQANASSQTAKQTGYYDWNYAVWAWENLKTKEVFDAEWDKVDKPFTTWQKLNKRNRKKAQEQLKTHPQAALIKKGADLYRMYFWWADRANSNRTLFWQVYEPNCYEGGEMYGMVYEKSNYRFTDEWAQMNIFTGKCDWPDWRSAKGIAGDVKRKAEFMGNLKFHTKNGKH